MMDFDVFNGDADGICGILQLRLHNPRKSTLITGVKRDVQLLEQVDAARNITVVDIAMSANTIPLQRLLEAGSRIEWFDHHFTGNIPEHSNLTPHIDTSPEVCSSVIIDKVLGGTFRPWAVVAAFGDNLIATAKALAKSLGLTTSTQDSYQELGQCINYNAYGNTLNDLTVNPADLLSELEAAKTPLQFLQEFDTFPKIKHQMKDDLTRAESLTIENTSKRVRTVLFPDAAWSRRVLGTYANTLSQSYPDHAHVLLTKTEGSYVASLRAPISEPFGAHEVARLFTTGGGREASAGVNALAEDDISKLLLEMEKHYG
jgi:hypothetical protein